MQKRFALALAPVAGLLALPAQAQTAAAMTAFTDSITEVSTSIGVFGTALVGVTVIGVGFMIVMKYIRKIRGAA